MKFFFKKEKLKRSKTLDLRYSRHNLLIPNKTSKEPLSAINELDNRELLVKDIYLDFDDSSEYDEKEEKIDDLIEETYVINTDLIQLGINGKFYKVRLTLADYAIICYDVKPKANERPLLVINFNQISADAQINKRSGALQIFILGFNNKIEFKSENKELFANFLSFLNYFVINSKGAKENLVGLCLRNNFYKDFYYSEENFLHNAKTGDVLIFRGNEFVANCQRFYTRDRYDHVALLVRKPSGVYFYESLSVTVIF